MLIFLSPVINAFIEHLPKRKLLIYAALFWSVEIWFGCIKGIENFGFNQGYSIIHFSLIYMMARLVALYKDDIMRIEKSIWLIGYILCTIILFVMYGAGIRWGYANPVNVLSSFCLFIPFLHYSFHSTTINWIAKNTFAVYIIQVTSPAITYLCKIDKYLLGNLNYSIYLLSSFGVIILFFALCIIYDKMREHLTSPVEKWVECKIGTSLYNKNLFQ